MNSPRPPALPVLSAFLLTLSFPKPGLSFLAWVALTPLFFSIKDKPPRAAFKDGFSTGLVFFVSSIYWLIIAMNRYGGLNLGFSVVLLVILSAYLALYYGLFAASMAHILRVHPALLALAAPAVWVGLELFRNYFLSGFPWNLLGYSQAHNLGIIQFADITGVYGVSALIVLVNVSVFLLFHPDKYGRRYIGYSTAGAAVILFVVVFIYGRYRLDHPPVESGRLKVSIVQGSVDQFHKWDPVFQEEVFNTYSRLTTKAAETGPGLVVWPETATPFVYGDVTMWPRMLELVGKTRTHLLTGTMTSEPLTGDSTVEYNSAYLLSPDGRPPVRYDKTHLVPFGEYIPFQKYLNFIPTFANGIGNFGSGERFNVMDTGRGRFGTAVCFESIFPDLVRRFTLNGADFLAIITNDSWYGLSAAPYQHLDIAAFRAVENRRAVVRAANTGISAIILPSGEITKPTQLFHEAVINGDIPLVRVASFYTSHGDLFAYACSAAGALTLLYALWRSYGNA